MRSIILLYAFAVTLLYADEGGYSNPGSVAQGESIRFCLSTSRNPFTLTFYRIGGSKRTMMTVPSLAGRVQNVPANGYSNGYNWSTTYTLTVPNSWPSGIYTAEFPSVNGTESIPFIVRQNGPGSTAQTAVVLMTNTFQAYNNTGGKSLYDYNSSGGARSYQVTYNRPYGALAEMGWPENLVGWMENEGIPYECLDDVDLDQNPAILDNYEVLVFAGHEEYWSKPERSAVEQFINRGGRVINLSGNTCWWQVRFEDNGRTQVCYKWPTIDPQFGVNNSVVTVNWYDSPVNNPENRFLGVSSLNAGYVNFGSDLPQSQGYGDYAVCNSQYWIYKGTGLQDGDQFGYDEALVGYETNGALYTWKNGIPTPTGSDGTPSNFRILGISPAMDFNSGNLQHATMGILFTPGGGMVFNSSTINWVNGLASDFVVQQITRNVFDCSLRNQFPPEILSWSPGTTANATVNNDPIVENERNFTIGAGAALPMSIRINDPRGERCRFYWTVNNVITATDSTFTFNATSNFSGVNTVNAFAYNSHDTASISWTITVSGATASLRLISPANFASCQPTTLSLNWSAASGAVRYNVQVSTDSSFSSILVNDSSVTGTSRQLNGLNGNNSYYWRVIAVNDTGGSQASPVWTFSTLSSGILRDDFNRPNGAIAGSNKWVAIRNQPNNGGLNISNNMITPVNDAGYGNFGLAGWDSLFTGGSEVSITLKQKSGNIFFSSLFLYARMNSFDYNTATGYRLRYLQQSGASDIMEIHRVGPGYAPITVLASVNVQVNVNDVITFRVLCDNQTMVGLINGAPVITASDAANNPSQWNFAIAGCVFPTPVLFDNFQVSSQPSSGIPQAPPPSPVLLLPANDAGNQSLVTKLLWRSANGTASYQLQLSSDSTFNTVTIKDTAQTDTSYAVQTLQNSTRYFWRVSGSNASGTSGWSQVFHFTTLPPQSLAAPVLLSPANNAGCQSTTLALTWSASTGAIRYQVQLAADPLFSSLLVNDSTVTGTSRQAAGLAGNSTYYWRVTAIDAGGVHQTSLPWSFTTIAATALRDDFNRPNGAIAGSNKWVTIRNQPNNGGINISNNMITPVNDASYGNFGLAGWDSLFTGGSEVSITLKQKSGNIFFSSLFLYARMSSFDYNTATGYRLRYLQQSGASDIMEIHRVGPGYAPITVLASVNVQVNVNDVITFRVLCDNQTMVGLVNGIPVITATDAANTPAQWNFAICGCVFPTPVLFDNFQVSSQPASITIPVPAAPILSSPVNGGTDQPLRPTLVWLKTAGASAYRLEIGADSTFVAAMVKDTTQTDTSYNVTSLQNGTWYFWRVSASNAAGSGLWSSVWHFNTLPGPFSPPGLLSPSDNAACQPTTQTFTWSASPGSVRYRLTLATDASFNAIFLDDSTLTGTTRQVAGLADNTVYYWKVTAVNTAGMSQSSVQRSFTTFASAVLRDDFNRPDGPLAGSNKWIPIQNHPDNGTMLITGGMIAPSSSAGAGNFGGVAWDSLESGGAEASLTLRQKSGNTSFSSLFIYARMNSLDYNTATGYRLRYLQQTGSTDVLEIHRIGPGYANNTVMASVNTPIKANDVISFRVLCDNRTMVGLVNGTPVVTVVDASFNPTQWYFAIRGCVFATPVLFDNFQVSSQRSAPSSTVYHSLESAGEPILHPDPAPKEFSLAQNFPNPFNPTTDVGFRISDAGYVTLKIYDILGRNIATLVNEWKSPGEYHVQWNAANISSGIYFYHLDAVSNSDPVKRSSEVRKMLLIR